MPNGSQCALTALKRWYFVSVCVGVSGLMESKGRDIKNLSPKVVKIFHFQRKVVTKYVIPMSAYNFAGATRTLLCTVYVGGLNIGEMCEKFGLEEGDGIKNYVVKICLCQNKNLSGFEKL